ncbi:MAG: TolC family protein [Cyanobacteria bacterium J06600_6]
MFYSTLILGIAAFNLQIAAASAIPVNTATRKMSHPKPEVMQRKNSQHQFYDSPALTASRKQEKPINSPLEIPQKPQDVKTKENTSLALQEAIEIGINNNRQLAITRLELNRAQANLSAEKAARFPSLSTQTTLNRSLDPSGEIQTNIFRDSLENQLNAQQSLIDEIEAQLPEVTDPAQQSGLQSRLQEVAIARTTTQTQIDELDRFATTSVSGSVGLQYNLYSPQRGAFIDLAEEEVLFRQLEVQRITKELILNITNAYYDLQQIDREVEIAQSDVQSRRRGANIVNELLKASLATRLDLLNVEVELDNARQVLRNSLAEQQIARRSLAEILSLSPQVTPFAADVVKVAGNWDLALEETIILGFKNRVELEQQLALRRRGQASRRAAYAPIKPQVSLFANYDYLQLYTDEPGDDALRGFGDGYSVGVAFNWTLWDGGAALARARSAQADIAIAEQQYGDSAEQIRLEIEQAYYQVPAALENVETASKALKRAEEAVTAANKRFRANLNTQTEVLDAQNRLIQAQNNLVQAIIGHNRAFASLQRAVGETTSPTQQK